MRPLNISLQPAARETKISWRMISPSDHIVHIYEDDQALLDTLEEFIVGGLRTGESVIAIATSEHLAEINQRLNAYSVDVAHLRKHYICREAEEALSRFLVGGWPDEELFRRFVDDVLEHARSGGRRVRVFGEMVAILWAMGNKGATIKLEQLWNQYCHTGAFPLLCAYPKSGFPEKSVLVNEICAAHSRIITAAN